MTILIAIGMILVAIVVILLIYRGLTGNNALWMDKVIFVFSVILMFAFGFAKAWVGILVWGLIAYFNGRRIFR